MHENLLCGRLSDLRNRTPGSFSGNRPLCASTVSAEFSSKAEPQKSKNKAFWPFFFSLSHIGWFTFQMNEYFRFLGCETKKSWGGKGGEGGGRAMGEMWGSYLNYEHWAGHVAVSSFSSLWLLGSPTTIMLRKLHRQKPCLTCVWDMLDNMSWFMTGNMKDTAPPLYVQLSKDIYAVDCGTVSLVQMWLPWIYFPSKNIK